MLTLIERDRTVLIRGCDNNPLIPCVVRYRRMGLAIREGEREISVQFLGRKEGEDGEEENIDRCLSDPTQFCAQ